MSNASTGASNAIVILMELEPMTVYRKAKQLVQRHPETAPQVDDVGHSHGQLLDGLNLDPPMKVVG